MVVVVISVGFGSVFFSLRWVAKIFIIQFLVESYIEKEKVLQLVLKVLNMQICCGGNSMLRFVWPPSTVK